jgi:hypothetical protein
MLTSFSQAQPYSTANGTASASLQLKGLQTIDELIASLTHTTYDPSFWVGFYSTANGTARADLQDSLNQRLAALSFLTTGGNTPTAFNDLMQNNMSTEGMTLFNFYNEYSRLRDVTINTKPLLGNISLTTDNIPLGITNRYYRDEYVQDFIDDLLQWSIATLNTTTHQLDQSQIPSNVLLSTQKAAANGLATLDGGSKLTASQIPTTLTLSGLTIGSTNFFNDGTGQFAIRNGISPQQFRLYNTYTDASNYETGEMSWSGNALTFGSNKLGTGIVRDVIFEYGGAESFRLNTNGIQLSKSLTYAADNTYTIGAAAKRLKNIYVAGAVTTGTITTTALPVYDTDAAAGSGGLTVGQWYRTTLGAVMVKL